MRGEWQRVAACDDTEIEAGGRRLESLSERCYEAAKVVFMIMVGTGIGGLFVLVRWLLDMKT